ncbi:uncharacterized protein BKCO1_900050 [Diplodia corticola]|uniref:Uncharacterized protein n=1 Tax=Diplodia corticola TaxID=236234 RepID=A0A1J9R5L9_9PEZI|nr:uncharacterized protein BKCO1_900050 [Diplodia corticola]OJD36806.1 hypothetical protein BKCO1_900050 [Diplodia corticola]
MEYAAAPSAGATLTLDLILRPSPRSLNFTTHAPPTDFHPRTDMVSVRAPYRCIVPLLQLIFLIATLPTCVDGLPTPTNVQPSAQSATTTSSPTPRSGDGTANPLGALARQWQNPSDLSSVLMIIGGDIVQKAVAQLRGRHIAPVAFSFGFVSYSFTSLLSAIGDGRLMPMSDCPSLLTNLSSGYSRTNNSWVLGRILRDIEKRHAGSKASLHISIYRTTQAGGRPARDRLWWTGAAVLAGQLGVACVPWALDGDWLIAALTVAGTALALAGSALPQWAEEKWACRTAPRGRYCLTRGNGHQHAVVVLSGHADSLNLEDLATARGHPVHHTRLLLGVLAVCWIAFLLCVAGLEENTWYLLGVGFLGMVQNVTAAGKARDPSAMGVPMESVDEICDGRVMEVLQKTEKKYPKVGLSLLPIFFPGELRPDEREFFDEMKATAKERLKAAEKETRPPPPPAPTPLSSGSSSGTLTPSFSRNLPEKERP